MILYNNPKHLRRWGGMTACLSVIAIAVRLWFEPGESETLSGGSRIGLTFGILGGILILSALSLTFLRFVPSWWFIGSRAFWLKGHIWLGLLSFVLILCHTGLRFGGFFERILYLVYLLVVLTGIIGVILQQFLPRWMTLEVPCEVPFEQISNVCITLREKADMEMKKCQSPLPATTARIHKWYSDVVRPFLCWPFDRKNLLSDAGKAEQMFADMRALAGVEEELSRLPDLVDSLEHCFLNDPLKAAEILMQIRNLPDDQKPLNSAKQVESLEDACKIDAVAAAGKQVAGTAAFKALRTMRDFAKPATLPDLLDRLEEYCTERRRLGRQESLQRLLHGWLYFHVPLSWAMTVMMLAHAVVAGLYYHQQ